MLKLHAVDQDGRQRNRVGAALAMHEAAEFELPNGCVMLLA